MMIESLFESARKGLTDLYQDICHGAIESILLLSAKPSEIAS